jgi:hypothetical protein
VSKRSFYKIITNRGKLYVDETKEPDICSVVFGECAYCNEHTALRRFDEYMLCVECISTFTPERAIYRNEERRIIDWDPSFRRMMKFTEMW